MNELERAKYLTVYYDALKEFRLVPFGFLFTFTLGLVWIVLGSVDHFILVREMRPLAEGDYARAE